MSTEKTPMSAPVDAVVIEDSSKLILMRWKTELCNTGESCWCRLIVPEDNVQFRDGVDAWVIPDGSVTKSEAEHIVDIHNAWLESR